MVLLRGSLGVGKTTLTRGIAEGLGFLDPAGVSSPSFTLVNVYPGRVPIYHVDLYRLTGRRDLRSVGLDDFIGRDGVTVVEWSERLPFSVEPAVIVELEDAGGDRRRIRVRRGVALRKGARGQARGVSRSGRQSSTGWRCRR